MHLLILTLLFSICFSVSAQDITYQQKIKNYLTINGTYAQDSHAYDQMFEVIKTQIKSEEISEDTWIFL